MHHIDSNRPDISIENQMLFIWATNAPQYIYCKINKAAIDNYDALLTDLVAR